LTRKGRALTAAIDAIAGWAEKWVVIEEPAPAVRRRRKSA